MQRSSVQFNGIDILIDTIYNLIPDKNMVLVRKHNYYLPLVNLKDQFEGSTLYSFIVDDEKVFTRIKFEFIKHIKKHPNPEERVADWEWRDKNNLPDWDKFDRMVEKRKTKAEKEQEFKDELELKQLFDKHGLEYFGPLRND